MSHKLSQKCEDLNSFCYFIKLTQFYFFRNVIINQFSYFSATKSKINSTNLILQIDTKDLIFSKKKKKFKQFKFFIKEKIICIYYNN